MGKLKQIEIRTPMATKIHLAVRNYPAQGNQYTWASQSRTSQIRCSL